MPTYDITLPNGKTVEVDAPSADVAAKAAVQHYKKAKVGLVEGVSRSVRQGFTAGFDDELRGQKAGGPTLGRDVLQITGKRRTAAERKADADQVTATERARQAQFAKDHPFVDMAAQTAGGLANPLMWAGGGFVNGGKTLLSTMGRNALAGGLTGAVYGAGNATEGSRMAGATGGAAIGATIGGALPVIGRTAQAAGGVVDDLTGGAIGRGIDAATDRLNLPIRTSAERADAVAKKYVSDLASRAKVTPQVLRKAQVDAFGKPVTAAEAMGRRGEVTAGAVARRPGSTGDLAEAVVEKRQGMRPASVLADFEASTGVSPEAVRGSINDIVDAGRKAAKPLYDEAYGRELIQSDKLTELMQRPATKRGFAKAAEMMANDGKDPMALGVEFDPSGAIKYIRTPSMEAMDYVKRGIQDQIERDAFGKPLPTDTNRALSNLVSDFTGELKRANPKYGEALARAGDYKSAQAAYEMGGDLLAGRGLFRDPRAIADWVQKADPVKLEAARGGVANDLYLQVLNGKVKLKALQSPAAKMKLSALFGQRETDRFLARIAAELRMVKAEARLNPSAGSGTAEWAANMNDQASKPLSLNPMSYINQGAGAVASRFRTAPLNELARDRVGQILYGSPNELANMLEATAAAPVRRGAPVAPVMIGVSTGKTSR